MSDIPVTPHFNIADFACHDGTPYPVSQIDDEDPAGGTWLQTRLLPLCQTFEVVREAGGGAPIDIDSGFRTVEYDQKLLDTHLARLAAEGLPNDHMVAEPTSSDHPKGRAADAKHRTLKPIQFFNLILSLYEQGRLPFLSGVGLYPNFVHVSIGKRSGSNGVANDGHLRIWGGTRPTNVL